MKEYWFWFDITRWKWGITINRNFHQRYGAKVFPMKVICIGRTACIFTICLSLNVQVPQWVIYTVICEQVCSQAFLLNFPVQKKKIQFHVILRLISLLQVLCTWSHVWFLHWHLKVAAKNRHYLVNISCTCSVWRNNFHTYHATENSF